MLTARDTVGDRVTGSTRAPTTTSSSRSRSRSWRLGCGHSRGAARRRLAAHEPTLAAGPIALDETARRVTVDGATVDLSPREFSLLECLLRHPGQTLSRDQLLDQAWPFGVAVTPERGRRVRPLPPRQARVARALHRDVRGVGYRLADA